MNRRKKGQKLPKSFKPLFWSYNFDLLDLEKNKKTILLNIINFGDLFHWRWIKNFYGNDKIIQILRNTKTSEVRSRVRRLAEILFQTKIN